MVMAANPIASALGLPTEPDMTKPSWNSTGDLTGAGFAAGYTPITFAPLVSLTGPVQAQAPAAPTAEAPAAVAPIRYPTMADMPDNAYMTGGIPAYSGASIGNRSGADIRSDLSRIGEFFMSPLSTMASVAMTGKMPSEHMQGTTGGSNPFAGFLQGLQALFGGGQQKEEVPLGPILLSNSTQVPSIGGIGGATYNDALNIASGWGLSSEAANAAGTAAAALVAQGVDPSMAISLALMDASMAASQVPEGAPIPGGSTAPGGPTQGLPGLSRNAFDLAMPVASYPVGSQPAVTTGLGTGGTIATQNIGPSTPFVGSAGGGYAPSDFGGYGGGTVGETGAPGESSYGLDR